ncbi:TetR/AcrR family transcriptional regulator [Polycladidibacter hongkongensis]|uniref:TetR/AcrR family transcriptional regulator n=1 Tax=Polycladidibacter hongkongensis TaxID=1647556 RepID=UPI00082B2124|nr:TetR/AcrR family transcriptional regulator [Pseudovibrio hongkongensis]
MPKIVDRKAMRQKLLHAATATFQRNGYNSSTMNDIAETAGVAKGTLYLYFKNKQAIVDAVFDMFFLGWVFRVDRPETAQSLEAFSKQLYEAMVLSDDEATFVPIFYEVFGPKLREAEFRQRLLGYFTQLEDHYFRTIIHLQGLGEVKKDLNPRDSARALVGFVDGVVTHRGMFMFSNARHRKTVASGLALLLNGLRA